MKKLFALLAALVLTFALTACGGEEELPEIPDTVTMAEIDDYLNREDAQYIDLRNWDDKMKSGYISGFEFIPFFDYLEYENILVRTDGNWDFAAEDIVSQAGLQGLFDSEKTIFLMCGSGTRAGYVKAALDSLGYENVINVGGISDYDGANMVVGDGSYVLNPDVKGDYEPGTYYGFDPVGDYMAIVVINDKGGIANVIFDALSHGTTKQNLGYGYGMGDTDEGGDTMEWFEHANMLASYVMENQGWEGIDLTETPFDASWTALTVPHHVIEFDADNNPDSVAGVTVGAEGFVFAWNDAIAQASDSDLGVVETTITAEEWAAAHEAPYDYEDGVYYGHEAGYTALITIEDGMIVDVFLDAAHFEYGTTDFISMKRDYDVPADYPMNYTLNDNGTPNDASDDFYELDAGKLDWWGQADALEAAILDAQTWEWTVDATEGTIDAVAGVTIGVDGWKVAVEEALTEATPTE
ncbi:MAG: rhodanese-like domain-containing protein [Candidatus Izemoplasma sp.]|nr:rhodanese-like domain-containing protein [Candidatus Izemoplasma sp.]